MNLENLKKFELSREELKKVNGGARYVCAAGRDGQLTTFGTDSADVAEAWMNMQTSFGWGDVSCFDNQALQTYEFI
ncbi:hypothetical protein [Winogradskyella sp.]|uniref:hypothetical protein n=1 Tax=Winogradskyella sp. TaxID=1883156 RepID=UPI003BABFAF8